MTAMRRRRRHPSSSSPRSSRPLASLAAPVSATAATCLSLSLLLLLPLLPDPPCAEAALYVNPDPGSWRQGSEVPWDGEGVVAYPSEPAKFGREFDPAVTGRANLFLPPHGVDPLLCSLPAVPGLDRSGGGSEGGSEGDSEGGSEGGEDESGDESDPSYGEAVHDGEPDGAGGGRGRILLRHRRLRDGDGDGDGDDLLAHRYLLALSGVEPAHAPPVPVHPSGLPVRRRASGFPLMIQTSSLSSPPSPSPSSSKAEAALPIALLVERGGCTFQEKAVNAARLNRRLIHEAAKAAREGGAGLGGKEGEEDRDEEEPEANDADDGKEEEDQEDEDNAEEEEGGPSQRLLRGWGRRQGDDETGLGEASASDLAASPAGPAGGGATGGGGSAAPELPTLRIDYLVVYNDQASAMAIDGDGGLVSMDRPQDRPGEVQPRIDLALAFVGRSTGLALLEKMEGQVMTDHGEAVPDQDANPPEGEGGAVGSGTDGGTDGGDDRLANPPPYFLTAADFFPSTSSGGGGGWSFPILVDDVSGLGGSGRGRPPNSDQYRDAFDWVRYALIAMLIVSPVARGIFVWFAAGGRVQLRRDMFGNVVGLVVIRPINLHDPHSWPPAEEWTTGASSRMRIQKLTVEQVRSLPEIQYGHPSGEGDGGDRNAPLSDSVAEGTGAPQTATPVGPTVTGEDATGEDATGEDATGEDATGEDATGEDAGEAPAFTTTRCTSCSICIDDFEPLEKIRLLPRCGHAFHTDCIIPWLTEKRASCPLCKQNVLGAGTDGLVAAPRGGPNTFTDGIQEGDDGDDGGRTEQGGNSLLVDSGHSSDGGEGEFIGGVWQPNSRDDSREGHAQAPWVL